MVGLVQGKKVPVSKSHFTNTFCGWLLVNSAQSTFTHH